MSKARHTDRVRDPFIERGRRRAAVVASLLALFLLVALVKPWEAIPGPTSAFTTAATAPASATPTASAGATESPSAAPTAPSAPAPGEPAAASTFTAPGEPGGTWRSVDWNGLAPDDALGLVRMVLRWGHGYVALGGASRVSPLQPLWSTTDGTHWVRVPRDTTLWSSPDSIHWRLVRTGPATIPGPGLVIVGVAATASDVVAVTESIGNCAGTCPPQAEPPVVLWTSTDARRWVPHSVPLKWLPLRGGAVPLIAAGPAGFVIASPGSAPRLVVSTDGTTWRALAAGALPPGFVLVALAGTRSGYVGAGSAAVSGRSEAATVESSDGDHWPVSATLLPPTSADAEGSTITGLIVGRAGLIATGTTSAATADALWWQSADSRHWRALPTFAPLGPAPCAQVGCGRTADGVVVGDGDQLLALRASPLAAAWVSIDGLAWRRLQSKGLVPGQPPVGAVLMPGGVLLTYLSTTWLGTAHS